MVFHFYTTSPCVRCNFQIPAARSPWECTSSCLYVSRQLFSSYHSTSPSYLHQLCIVDRTTSFASRLPQTSLSSITTLILRIQAINVVSAAYFTEGNNTLFRQLFQMPLGRRKTQWYRWYGSNRMTLPESADGDTFICFHICLRWLKRSRKRRRKRIERPPGNYVLRKYTYSTTSKAQSELEGRSCQCEETRRESIGNRRVCANHFWRSRWSRLRVFNTVEGERRGGSAKTKHFSVFQVDGLLRASDSVKNGTTPFDSTQFSPLAMRFAGKSWVRQKAEFYGMITSMTCSNYMYPCHNSTEIRN